MKRNLVALILSITISAVCLTGCGSEPASDNVASESTDMSDSDATDTEIVPDAPDETAPMPDNNTSETTDEENPAKPETEPEESADDVNTNESVKNVDGSDSDTDTAPNKGETDKTDKPAQTDKPNKPAQTDKPNKPAQTDKTDKPAQTDKPSKPAQTDKPDKPNKPDKPTKPSKPDETDKDDTSADTGDFASSLYQIFEIEMEKTDDIEQVAAKIVESGKFGEVMMGSMPVEEGYLAGFEVEIKGFKKGVTFGPMIGTIPFVGYIFETDTPDELVATLEKEHKLNWNICTSADRMFVRQKGNYVFFVMTPDSFGNN